MSNIANNIFESIDVIVSAKINNLAMDRIQLCTVVDASKRAQGIYTLQYTDVKFQVNNTDLLLNNGEQVYVGKPSDDYTNAFIISKKSNISTSPYSTNPFEDYLIMHKYNVNTNSNGKNNSLFRVENNKSYLGLECTVKHSSSSNDSALLITLLVQEKTYVRGVTYYFPTTEMLINRNEYAVVKKLIDVSNYKGKIIGAEVISKDSNLELKANSVILSFGELGSSFNTDTVFVESTANSFDKEDADPITMSLQFIYKQNGSYVIANAAQCENTVPDYVSFVWQQYINSGWQDIQNANEFSYTHNNYKMLTPEYKYRVKVIYNSEDIDGSAECISNEIIITNQMKILNPIPDTDKIKLQTTVSDFSTYYAENGVIRDLSEASIERKITLTADIDKEVVKNNNYTIDVYWKIPYNKTMLSYNTEDSEYLGGSSSKLDDVFDEYRENGNYIYAYSINKLPTEKNLNNSVYNNIIYSETTFGICDFFAVESVNNTIEAIIEIKYKGEVFKTYSTSLNIKFTKPGLCKTDSFVLIRILNEAGKIQHRVLPGSKYYVSAMAYDCNGKKLPISNKNTEWTWHCGGTGFSISPNEGLSGEANLTVPAIISTGCNIIKFTVKHTDREIVGYLPVAIEMLRAGESPCYGMIGPTSITYKSSGGEPEYYNHSYGIYETMNDNGEFLLGNYKWELCIDGQELNDGASGIKKQGYPTLAHVQSTYQLIPNRLYVENADKNVYVKAYKNVTTESGKIEQRVKWIQPILITRSNSFSSYLNDWDGNLSVNKDENTVLAARLGAGKKEIDGTFSGVVLGDWSNDNGGTALTGVYGFDKGAQSYGLRQDGTAFFGKDGSGRIEFDGNEGLIYSANFDGWLYDDKGNIVVNNKKQKLLDVEGKYGKNGSYWDLRSGKFIINDILARGEIETNIGKIGPWIISQYGITNTQEVKLLDRHTEYSYGLTSSSTLTNNSLINTATELPYCFYIGGSSSVLETWGDGWTQISEGSALEPLTKDSAIDHTFTEITSTPTSDNIIQQTFVTFESNDSKMYLLEEYATEDEKSNFYRIDWEYNKCTVYIKQGLLDFLEAKFDKQVYGRIIQLSYPIYLKTHTQETVNFGVLQDGSAYAAALHVDNETRTAPAQTNSDRNIKNTITPFDNLYYWEEEKQDKFFDALMPSSYKYNNGSSNRLHTGFIAQDVYDALVSADLNSDDYAYVCCDINPITEEKTNWRLRYEEFVALNTWQIQKLKKRITELEAKLDALENR